MAYYRNETLVAVGILEQTIQSLSSVYFYFDPEIAELSPGIGSLLGEVAYAAETGLSYLYLGYCVKDCPSLAYKGNIKPHQTLQGRPELNSPAVWL